MTDLERRATEAVIKLRQQWGTQEPRDSDLQMVRAALNVHAEWLEEQGLEMVCTGRPHSRKPTIEELEKILEGRGGRVRITPAGEVVVQQDD